ncbi:LuxR C-terminal-related transcriptional regulator [Streptomyces sp. NPDC003023]|uniref:helix-turn-helix transcriptional regulator n=1 Tax=Streptomyces sp. NPDC003023 TaxID=3364675 RepID=UPI0036C5B04F
MSAEQAPHPQAVPPAVGTQHDLGAPAPAGPSPRPSDAAGDVADEARGAYTALVEGPWQDPARAGDGCALPRDVRDWLGERRLLSGRDRISSPERALHDLLAEHRERLDRSWEELRSGLEAVDDVLRLLPGVRHAGRETVEAEFFDDRTRLRQRIDDLDVLCRDEVLGLRRTFPAPELLEDSLGGDLRMLDRGVSVRLLVSIRAARRPGAARYLSVLVERGGQVRVTTTVPLHLNIVDRAVTVLALGPVDGGEVASGDVILHSARLAKCFAQVFEHHWGVGRPWQAVRPGSGGSACDWSQREREVLALLASGAKDEAIARRLGCSERTLRRLLTALVAKLGAESRFAAGVQAARLGLLD